MHRLDGSFARLALYLYKARLFCLRRWHWLAMKKHQSGCMLSVFFFFHVMSPPPLLSLLYLRRPLWWKKAKQRGVLTLVITAGRRQERTSLTPFFLLLLPLLSFLPGLVFESDHIKSHVLDVWQIHNTAQVNVTPPDVEGLRGRRPTATDRYGPQSYVDGAWMRRESAVRVRSAKGKETPERN